MKVLIIEDEIKAARELANILLNIDDTIVVCAVIESVEKALLWFAENEQPDLVLSDIQLADGLCFEIYRQFEVKSPIIFCTAFDDYMMDSFDTNVISYLLKPITKDKVARALDKFHNLKSAFEKDAERKKLSDLLQQLKYNYKTALLVNQKEKIIPVKVKDIAFFFLDTSLLTIVTITNQKYFLTATLDEIEQMLDPELFYRANRQFLINKEAIDNAERFFARKLVVKLKVTTPQEVIVSKAKSTDFLQWLGGGN